MMLFRRSLNRPSWPEGTTIEGDLLLMALDFSPRYSWMDEL